MRRRYDRNTLGRTMSVADKEPTENTRRKRVRFAGIQEKEPEKEEEEPLVVTDDLIESLEKESPTRRHRAGLPCKALEAVTVPGEALLFVKAKVKQDFTGAGMVRIARCCKPGNDSIILYCLVSIKNGRLNLTGLNLRKTTLLLRRRDLLSQVDVDAEQEVGVIKQKVDANKNVACSCSTSQN